jgi:hypothetical protein
MISNGMFNLVIDKAKALEEVFRTTKKSEVKSIGNRATIGENILPMLSEMRGCSRGRIWK